MVEAKLIDEGKRTNRRDKSIKLGQWLKKKKMQYLL